MTRTTPELAPPSPNFQAPYTANLQCSRVSNLAPSGHKAGTLPLGHSGLSRIRSIQRENIVIAKKFELEILTNLYVLDLPESEKHNFGIMSVCVSVNKITRKLLEI
ncbi:hypothetical protein AVEN_253330-1 [Araneus ventricosus]|uniref:Uncharacterized protein n=1 Tax=Araneus ventricosus TaxID=182803 RepID=A0A4Y2VLU1_ARAVE|nr:hypothetical protein AVEN_253330-1 [Araneus ventricosus]